jgi:hypothetical protein
MWENLDADSKAIAEIVSGSCLLIFSDHQQSAFGAILHADTLEAPNIHLERAKWLWNGGQLNKAMFEL